MSDNECKEHPMPEIPVGVLYCGGFYCLDCDPSQGLGASVYRVNVYPYRATCLDCGKTCVEPRTPAWPELFVRDQDVHRKCRAYALETFFARGNPFDVCGCVVPGELARDIHEHVREAHEGEPLAILAGDFDLMQTVVHLLSRANAPAWGRVTLLGEVQKVDRSATADRFDRVVDLLSKSGRITQWPGEDGKLLVRLSEAYRGQAR